MFAGLSSSVALLGLAALSSAFSQKPLSVGSSSFESYDTGLFNPVEDLGLLSTADYTTLGHPLFPNYDVRIKKSDFCDGTVR